MNFKWNTNVPINPVHFKKPATQDSSWKDLQCLDFAISLSIILVIDEEVWVTNNQNNQV